MMTVQIPITLFMILNDFFPFQNLCKYLINQRVIKRMQHKLSQEVQKSTLKYRLKYRGV